MNDKLKPTQRYVVNNKYQGEFKRVLCVCTAGCLRSPTAAWLLSREPWNFNTRAAGTEKEYAIVLADHALVAWAQEIVCMDSNQVKYITDIQKDLEENYSRGFEYYPIVPVHNLMLEDNYAYRDKELVELLTVAFEKLFPVTEQVKKTKADAKCR